MEVRNCKGCGRLFNYLGGAPLCANCLQGLEEKFSQVKEYIYENPSAGIQIVAEENDVTVSQIKRWIREERLSFSDDSPIGVECESCGKTIKTGRFCAQCKDKMKNNLGSMYKNPAPVEKKTNQKESPKMRFLDN